MYDATVGRRVKSFWVLEQVKVELVRNVSAGVVLTTVIVDIVCYGQVLGAVNRGQLPWFTPDVTLMLLALVEAAAALAWAAAVRRRRRAVLLACALISSLSVLLMLSFPTLSLFTPAEFCSGDMTPVGGNEMTEGVSGGSVWRAMGVALVGAAGAAARGGLWVHGLMLIEEQTPLKMSLHYGILVTIRVAAYTLLPKILVEVTVWVQVLIVAVSQLVNLLQFLRIPAHLPPKDGYHHYSMLSSVGRVLCNGVATAQMVAFGLLCAALWNYGWNESDLVKTMYLIVEKKTFMANQFTMFLYHAVIIVVILYGMLYSSPKRSELAAVGKVATVASALLVALYAVSATLVTCERGLVAGLAADNYTQPACSLHCGCGAPQSEFAPVCVPDTLTTYVSPCHAGCAGAERINGVTVYTECACAAAGACALRDCSTPYQLQRVLAAIGVTLTLLALQSLGASVLRGVQPRDRPPALALSAALALLCTCGVHPASMAMQVWQCAWSERGVCHLRGAAFPAAATALSGALAGAACLLAAGAQWTLRRRAPPPAAPAAASAANGDQPQA